MGNFIRAKFDSSEPNLGRASRRAPLEVKAQFAKVFETEDCASNDVIIDSLHNPDLQVIVLGHVTPYKL